MTQRTGGAYLPLYRPRIYDLVQTLVGTNRSHRVLARDYIKASPGDRILDMGCGTAEILPALGDVLYTGFDINEDYIATARARFPSARFFVGSNADLENSGQTFDLVIALSVLHHLEDEAVSELMATANRVLRPGGRLLTYDGCFEPHQNPLARFLLQKDRGRFVRTEEHYLRLACHSFPDVRSTLRRDLLNIPCTLIIMEASRPE